MQSFVILYQLIVFMPFMAIYGLLDGVESTVERVSLDISFNFLRTGYYDRYYGLISYRSAHGFWWLMTNSSTTEGRSLVTLPTAIGPGVSYRGLGLAIRCVVREG